MGVPVKVPSKPATPTLFPSVVAFTPETRPGQFAVSLLLVRHWLMTEDFKFAKELPGKLWVWFHRS